MADTLAAPHHEHERGAGAAAQSAAGAPSDAPLYWSRRGEVACALHAPAPYAPRWVEERWAHMPAEAMCRHGVEYQCQHCSPSGTPILRRRLKGDADQPARTSER